MGETRKSRFLKKKDLVESSAQFIRYLKSCYKEKLDIKKTLCL